jgi:hypothetical protein
VSTTPQPLYHRERPGTHCTGGWVGPRACLDMCEKSHPHRDSIPGPSSPYIYQLGYPTHSLYNKLWYNFWGQLLLCHKGIYTPKEDYRNFTNTRSRDSCRKTFQKMEIMTLYSQYVYSLVSHTINNKHLFDTNN